jgi:cytosine/uracil/thiamine/allantoin permease
MTAREVPRMVASQVAEEVHYPDGRVSLASTDEIAGSGYANDDLAPLPIERRTWTTCNYNWVVGFAAAMLLYWGLTAMTAGRSRVPQHAYAGNR